MPSPVLPVTGIPASLYANYYEAAARLLAEQLPKHRFWYIGSNSDKCMIYDSVSGLLWDAAPNIKEAHDTATGSEMAAKLTLEGLKEWRLPSKDEMISFARPDNPLRVGNSHRLLGAHNWLIQGSRIDLENLSTDKSYVGYILACNDALKDKPGAQVIKLAVQKNWQLRPYATNAKSLDLGMLHEQPDLVLLYQDVDYLSARLPRLDPAQFSDPGKGLWELWGMDPELLARQGVRARDPALDVRDWNVAIDFGTSSTVVAYDDNDQHKLLRIGVGNYWEQERPEHYENPTVLEFLDFRRLLEVWQSEACRPGVSWGQVRCSHAALQNFRDNKSNPRAVASTLTKLKHWALREADMLRLRLTDRTEPKGMEIELPALTLRNPVRGQPLGVSPQDPFDPIELYAWFLGLTINWRGRGLFLRYYMTFPVDYPREVKDKLLASFRRGLQRSLPVALIEQPVFQRFLVEERASEPAAYAASAMASLGIAPTAEGTAYAVFDFGGGTADFDFGYYRLPTAEEEDEGKEEVFEHFGSAGDKFLGGENLLENLAYRVFRHNLDVCRKSRIAFTRPLDADDFPGSEMFLEQTQAASTNTVMLMARLRPLWEEGQPGNSTGIETLDLLNREGQKESCQLQIPLEELNAYLQQRIEQGVYNFLAALQKAFAQQMPSSIQVLLAGNASRTHWVQEAFHNLVNGQASEPASALQQRIAQLFARQDVALNIHEPLPADAANPFKPTAKTGVALGLLRLCPGSPVKVINRAQECSGDEAPFAHYVGRLRQGRFQVGIAQGGDYGQWHELGTPSEGVFNLYHTQSPRAHTGEMQQGETGLHKQRLDLYGHLHGQRVFARVVGPSAIEVCTAVSVEAIAQNELDNLSTLNLGK